MSHHDYQASKEIAAQDRSFASLIMAAMRKADSHNAAALESIFPRIHSELRERYNAPGGLLKGETLTPQDEDDELPF